MGRLRCLGFPQEPLSLCVLSQREAIKRDCAMRLGADHVSEAELNLLVAVRDLGQRSARAMDPRCELVALSH